MSLEASRIAHTLSMQGYDASALEAPVHLQPGPVYERREREEKNTFSTGKIHQNELATPISLQQQFATCLATNLLGDIITQETTQDKFFPRRNSAPPFTSSPLQKDLTSNSGFDEPPHLCRNTVDLCRTPTALDRIN